MNKYKFYHQGDVGLVEATLPEQAREIARNGRIVLAEGEVTGHAHAIHEREVRWFAHAGEHYVSSEHPFTLVHEEHDSIMFPPGTYRVLRQREYSPRGIRRVTD